MKSLACAVCNTVFPMVEMHVCERGWLCDGCYFANEPWMGSPDDHYDNGNMESC